MAVATASPRIATWPAILPSSIPSRSTAIATARRATRKPPLPSTFAAQIVRTRDHVSDAEVAAVKAAGYSNAEVIEIVLHVALNTLTNYVNEVAKTEIDFPVIRPFG